MERVSFVLQIKEGMEDEYEKRHKVVYADLLDAFAQVGIHTYSIFRHGCTLFAYLEADNFTLAMSELSANPANLRWQEFMKPIMEQGGDEPLKVISEVFHFESKAAH